MHTFDLYSTFLSYPKFDKFIDIYTFWKKKYMNNRTIYCHLTVVNSYIQCIHLHIPIDIDTCTYTLGGGGYRDAHKGNFVVIYQAGK